MLVLINHREFTTESNRTKLSIMRFWACHVSWRKGWGRCGVAYLVAGLEENLIVFAESNAKDDGSNVLEAMYPLLPLTSLPTNVEHAVVSWSAAWVGQSRQGCQIMKPRNYLLYTELTHLEARFVDTRGLCSCS